MEKRREIPGPKPMSPSRADAERIIRRIEQLGITVKAALVGAGYAEATYFRFKKGEASVATFRDVDEWVAREEGKRKREPVTTTTEQESLLAEWADLGEQLLAADPAFFHRTIDGLRDVLESVKLQRRGFSKMFRATPDSDR